LGDGRLPFASIAIPVRNEEGSIAACLDAVLAQDYPRDRLEVIVVDGGSRDRTRARVEEVAARSDVPVRLLDNPQKTTPAGLNRAIDAARGEFLVRVDGHSVPEPRYVRRSIEGAIELGAALAGGWVDAAGTNAFGRAVAAALASPFAMGNAVSWRRPAEAREVGSVPCGAYRLDALRRIGGFDEEQLANQDYEANYRLRRAGEKVFILADVSYRYVPRDSPGALARQFLRYGFYKARTMIKHPSSIRLRHLAPATALLAVVVLAAAAPFSPLALALLAAALALYGVGLAAATALAARTLDTAAALRLPLVFATMHVCWGIGNAAGLVRWLPRRRALRATIQPISA
jgi:glycosyltransferase involved in cell wall biosynthesis